MVFRSRNEIFFILVSRKKRFKCLSDYFKMRKIIFKKYNKSYNVKKDWTEIENVIFLFRKYLEIKHFCRIFFYIVLLLENAIFNDINIVKF